METVRLNCRAWLKDFVKEVDIVCKLGNISRFKSGMIRACAFSGCNGLSRSYGRTLLTFISHAKQQFDRFDATCSELTTSCRTVILGTRNHGANNRNKLILPVVNGDKESDMQVSSFVQSNIQGLCCELQTEELEALRKMFKDIDALVAKYKEIATGLMEKLDSLKIQCANLVDDINSWYLVSSTLDAIYAKLKDIEIERNMSSFKLVSLALVHGALVF